MSETIFREIESNYALYSEVEKKIAKFILDNPEQFIQCSMPEAAKRAEVSQGSLNNFARKFFGVGFAALKIQIAQQIQTFHPPAFSKVNDLDDAKDILKKTIDQMKIAFNNTYELNSADSLEKAADHILKAKRIDLYGVFLSGIAARHFQYHLLRLGFSAHHVSDVLLSPVSATTMDSNSLVIAISHSGKTVDVIEPVKIAKENGAPVVAITSSPTSPLARIADVTLLASRSPDTIDNRLSEIQFTQMLLCNSICTHILHKIDKDGENRYFKMQKIIGSHGLVD